MDESYRAVATMLEGLLPERFEVREITPTKHIWHEAEGRLTHEPSSMIETADALGMFFVVPKSYHGEELTIYIPVPPKESENMELIKGYVSMVLEAEETAVKQRKKRAKAKANAKTNGNSREVTNSGN